MNKLFFTLTIFFSFFCNGQTQKTIGKFRAGITAGLAVSDINGTDARDTDNDFHKVGLIGGLLVNTNVSKKDVLQLEINYVQAGSLQPPDSLNNGYSNISLSYIEIPLVIKHRVNFSIRKKPVDKLDLEAGFSFGQLISQKVIGASNYLVYGSNALYNKTIASLVVGADYNISNNFYFCLRYSNSFIPAIKRNPLNISTITYTFNRGNSMVLQLSFKYIFEAKKTESIPKAAETQ
jgi:hypothetical protein